MQKELKAATLTALGVGIESWRFDIELHISSPRNIGGIGFGPYDANSIM